MEEKHTDVLLLKPREAMMFPRSHSLVGVICILLWPRSRIMYQKEKMSKRVEGHGQFHAIAMFFFIVGKRVVRIMEIERLKT